MCVPDTAGSLVLPQKLLYHVLQLVQPRGEVARAGGRENCFCASIAAASLENKNGVSRHSLCCCKGERNGAEKEEEEGKVLGPSDKVCSLCPR